MNRDWFARTQPETDGKLEALRQYPPVLFIDAHEMGSKDYFFPPNADPIYHEITDESVSWINDTYGAAMQQEFDRQKIPYFNYAVYDMFYMGYGDTVPTTGFLGAGMTFEKSSYDGIGKRLYEQYVAIWTSLSAAAANKPAILEGWAASFREALRQGTAGELEENEVVQPGNTVQNEVPDLTVRHYFLRADDPAKAAEVQALVRRLQRMDVQVRRLTAPLVVPDYTPYAGSPTSTTLPAGTYWVPMAQAQKHWVQAMLNEDTYTPFPYFYDVTAWSQPLLYNVAGGRSGAQLTPSSQVVPALPAPAEPALPADAPTVAVWQMSTGTGAIESSGWLRWLLDKKWRLPHDDVTAAEIATGALAGTDVLVVPDGDAAAGEKALGKKGVQVLRDWVAAGGRLVGLSEGAVLAGRLGVTGATFASPTSDIPGSLGARLCRVGPAGRRCGRHAVELRRVRPGAARRRPGQRGRLLPAGHVRAVRVRRGRGRAGRHGRSHGRGVRRPAGSCCSPRTRTSGPSPTGPRRSCATRCSGRIPPPSERGAPPTGPRRPPRPRRCPTSAATCWSRSGPAWRTAPGRCSRPAGWWRPGRPLPAGSGCGWQASAARTGTRSPGTWSGRCGGSATACWRSGCRRRF